MAAGLVFATDASTPGSRVGAEVTPPVVLRVDRTFSDRMIREHVVSMRQAHRPLQSVLDGHLRAHTLVCTKLRRPL